jgi:hypothetical protein
MCTPPGRQTIIDVKLFVLETTPANAELILGLANSGINASSSKDHDAR